MRGRLLAFKVTCIDSFFFLVLLSLATNVDNMLITCSIGRYSGKTDDGDTCCMHVDEGKVNNFTFAPALKAAGYTVGMFGK